MQKQRKPRNWDVEPDEFLGTDKEGREYYRLGNNVYRVTRYEKEDYSGEYTTWVCTWAAWEHGSKYYMGEE